MGLTRRSFFALAGGLLPMGGDRDPHPPALVGVLTQMPGDGRLFTIGSGWSLIADPDVPEYAVEDVRALERTAVALDRWRERRDA